MPKVASSHALLLVIVVFALLDCLAGIAAAKLGQMLLRSCLCRLKLYTRGCTESVACVELGLHAGYGGPPANALDLTADGVGGMRNNHRSC